jgi:dTDP-4-dehydrorhamnose 3,5-epimerase-like enzyme
MFTGKPLHPIANVDEVHTLQRTGPWETKSGGQLNVLFDIQLEDLRSHYFNYEKLELDKIIHDIRGLRSYQVDNLQAGAIGAQEWHRIRNELVFVTKGSIKWTCEDIYGQKLEFILNKDIGIWVPPFILHTYESLQDNSTLLVVANTLYLPDEPTTHDTFSASDFTNLQKQY